ncbi:MAG: DUF4079 family protein [Proteobacteria bacterium]|nr:DUF4079 family protein [Pseudomonadota bacterium]
MARWLAWGHPAWMVSSLALVFAALRLGLRLRRKRLEGAPRDTELLRRHLRLAKPAVAMILIGFTAGPVSSLTLRDWTPFTRFHGWMGLLVAALFAATAVMGHRLEQGRSQARDVHVLLALVSTLAAAMSAMTGLVLLP